jgi:hypothetical protein
VTGTTVSELWLIDSSAWLEYLTQDQDAIIYASAQAHRAQLITGAAAFRGLPFVIIPGCEFVADLYPLHSRRNRTAIRAAAALTASALASKLVVSTREKDHA